MADAAAVGLGVFATTDMSTPPACATATHAALVAAGEGSAHRAEVPGRALRPLDEAPGDVSQCPPWQAGYMGERHHRRPRYTPHSPRHAPYSHRRLPQRTAGITVGVYVAARRLRAVLAAAPQDVALEVWVSQQPASILPPAALAGRGQAATLLAAPLKVVCRSTQAMLADLAAAEASGSDTPAAGGMPVLVGALVVSVRPVVDPQACASICRSTAPLPLQVAPQDTGFEGVSPQLTPSSPFSTLYPSPPFPLPSPPSLLSSSPLLLPRTLSGRTRTCYPGHGWPNRRLSGPSGRRPIWPCSNGRTGCCARTLCPEGRRGTLRTGPS